MISFTFSILILQYAKLSLAGHWLIDGATSGKDHQPECHSNSVTVSCGDTVNKHGNYATGVRCCYDYKCSFGGLMCKNTSCDSPNCTWKNKAYSTAKSLCQNIPDDLINGRYNYRLCDKNELEQDKCRGSGCHFDGYHIWSSDTCTVSPCPTPQPTNNPTPAPSNDPSARPSNDPSVRPSNDPSARPSNDPSARPSNDPSARPSNDPSAKPSNPSTRPSNDNPAPAPSNDNPAPAPSNDPTIGPTTMKPLNDPTVGPITIPSNDPTVGPITIPSNDPTIGPTTAIPNAAANAEYALNLKDINFNGKQFDVSFGLSHVSKIVLCIVGILLFIICIMIIYGCLLNSRNRKNESFDVENVSDLEIQPKCASEIEKFVDQQ